jgi:hypothetical protein
VSEFNKQNDAVKLGRFILKFFLFNYFTENRFTVLDNKEMPSSLIVDLPFGFEKKQKITNKKIQKVLSTTFDLMGNIKN